MAEVLYEDRWITCEPDRLVMRGPFSKKVIQYRQIREVMLQPLTLMNSMWRPGPNLDLRLWLLFDPDRPRKQAVLKLDLGKWRTRVTVITNDPMKVAAIIEQRRSG